MNLHNFTPGASANRVLSPMTLQELQAAAPSAFAIEPHESRSARYTYIPTAEIIKGMADAGFLPFKASQSRTRDAERANYTKHMIRFRQMGSNHGQIVGDVFPEVVLVNSHDGTSAYKLMAGFFRLVCSNGLIVADSLMGSVTVMHKGNVIEDVIKGSLSIASQTDKALDVIGNWKTLQLTNGEQSAFADAARTLRFGDSEGKVDTPITAEQLLRPRRYDDAGNDLWHTMNRVQENVIKGGLHGVRRDNGRRRAVSTRQVKGIDQDVKLNKALWQLAERMAELKAA